MNDAKTDTLVDLVERNERIATELPSELAALATEKEIDTNTIVSVITATLFELVEGKGNPEVATNRLPELFDAYPELRSQSLEPLSRMAAHEDHNVQREGVRCLGFLGEYGTDQRELAVEALKEALNSNDTETQSAAVWSLVKIGLTEPAALTPLRERLTEFLNHSSERVRRYAVEALAVNALDSTEIGECDPQTSPENSTEHAAWALQRTVACRGLEIDTKHLIKETRYVDDDHEIAPHVASLLASEIENGEDSKLVAGAVSALGYLVLWQDDMREYLPVLDEIIDGETKHSQRVMDAAQAVRENGLSDSRRTFDPSTREAFELTVREPDESGPQFFTKPKGIETPRSELIEIPRRVAQTVYDADPDSRDSATVELVGTNATETAIGMPTGEKGTVRLDHPHRQKLGVHPGETIRLRAAPTIPARKVRLAVPPGVDQADVTEIPALEELSLQRYEVGEYLSLRVVTNSENFDETSMDRAMFELEVEEQWVPVRVEASYPDEANRITQNTQVSVTELSTLESDCWLDSESVMPEDSVELTSVMSEELNSIFEIGDEPT